MPNQSTTKKKKMPAALCQNSQSYCFDKILTYLYLCNKMSKQWTILTSTLTATVSSAAAAAASSESRINKTSIYSYKSQRNCYKKSKYSSIDNNHTDNEDDDGYAQNYTEDCDSSGGGNDDDDDDSFNDAYNNNRKQILNIVPLIEYYSLMDRNSIRIQATTVPSTCQRNRASSSVLLLILLFVLTQFNGDLVLTASAEAASTVSTKPGQGSALSVSINKHDTIVDINLGANGDPLTMPDNLLTVKHSNMNNDILNVQYLDEDISEQQTNESLDNGDHHSWKLGSRSVDKSRVRMLPPSSLSSSPTSTLSLLPSSPLPLLSAQFNYNASSALSSFPSFDSSSSSSSVSSLLPSLSSTSVSPSSSPPIFHSFASSSSSASVAASSSFPGHHRYHRQPNSATINSISLSLRTNNRTIRSKNLPSETKSGSLDDAGQRILKNKSFKKTIPMTNDAGSLNDSNEFDNGNIPLSPSPSSSLSLKRDTSNVDNPAGNLVEDINDDPPVDRNNDDDDDVDNDDDTVVKSDPKDSDSTVGTTVSPSPEEIYNQKWNIHLIWYSVFGLMILIGLLGNVLIIATITGHKSLHTVTNVFLLNLTASDLVTLLFNASFNLVFMLHGHWPFGHVFCVVNNFMTNLTLALSVFTIMFTSKERYNAIVHPLRKRMTKRRAIIHIILIWVAGTLFASPTLIYSRTIHSRHAGEQRSVCLIKWPDGYPGQSQIDFIYNLLFLILLYLLPLMTMGIAYTLMARVLWGSKEIGESSQAQLNLIRSKQKVVRMLIYVVVVFGVCWLPYHLYFLTTHYWPQIVSEPHIQQFYLGIYWLAMSNSMLNPIILLVMNQRFRRYSIKFLNFWPCTQMFPYISRASQSLPSEVVNTAIVCQGPNLETQTVLVCLDSTKASQLSFEMTRSSQRNGKTHNHNKQIPLRPTQSCRTSSSTSITSNSRPAPTPHRNGHHHNGS